MAICLDYQNVYAPRRTEISARAQIIIGIFLLIVLATRVWFKITCTNVGYELAKVRSQTVELDMQRRELELELSVLLRPDNLRREAKAKLGLETLKPSQIRRIG